MAGHSRIETYRYEFVFHNKTIKEIAKEYGLSEKTLKGYSHKYPYQGMSWAKARRSLNERQDQQLKLDLKNISRAESFEYIRIIVMDYVRTLDKEDKLFLDKLDKATGILFKSAKGERIEDGQPTETGLANGTFNQQNNFLGMSTPPSTALLESNVVLDVEPPSSYNESELNESIENEQDKINEATDPSISIDSTISIPSSGNTIG